MNERTERLRDIFERISDQTTFTERQTERRGWFRSVKETDDALAALVREMRERYAFRTSLDDDALVTIVKGYYAGASDSDLARILGSSLGTVGRARVSLHLFRDGDTDAPFPLGVLERVLDEGASLQDAADRLNVSVDTVRRYRRVVEARREASRVSHRYQMEFEEVLETAEMARRTGTDPGTKATG